MENGQMKIGVLTSGGDAPGMNAAIRAVVRTGINKGVKMIGIHKGYIGLINGDISEFNAKDVSDIMNRGGTVLHTARCPEMMTEAGIQRAAAIYNILGLDGLIVIGGDGSFRGCQALAELGVNAIGVPGTIDLDIACTEYTLGFDTAVNTGLDCIRKLRDTSSSHERCSVVEMMGRDAGYIAMWCAVAGGAEEVLVPENKGTVTEDMVIEQILMNRSRGKRHNLVVVAEGVGGTVRLAKKIQDITGIQTRATVLGHLQRGGTPTAVDCMHASMMGYLATMQIVNGEKNKIIAYNKGRYEALDLNEALSMTKKMDDIYYDVVKLLSI